MLTVLLLIQGVTGPILPPPRRPAVAGACPVGDPGDVVVCARDPDAYRLKPLPPHPDQPALPEAAVQIGDTRLKAEAEQVGLEGGAQSQRMMLRLAIPIGGRKRTPAP